MKINELDIAAALRTGKILILLLQRESLQFRREPEAFSRSQKWTSELL